MNFYRITFNRITRPDPEKPLHRHWEWFDLIYPARNYEEAREHGRAVAEEQGVNYSGTIRLLHVEGAALVHKRPGFQKVT